jgi:hypothetical protein
MSHRVCERIWTEESVIDAIHAEANAGRELSYMRTEKRVPALVRAAERTFGTWGAAIHAAGFDYEAIRRYRRWTRERVVERIREWYAKGADLSWNYISTELDPPLAAAALHAGRFACWADALRAAGLNPDQVSRYRRWTLPKIHAELLNLKEQGIPLDRESLSAEAAGLLAAVYRHGNGLVAERNALFTRAPYGARAHREAEAEMNAMQELDNLGDLAHLLDA